ncbi:MAG: hypothetical protein K8U57_35655 [Planctomycetes bacterium]|nr:hypothetical protein [Planctomycetota bacterium]
MSDEKKAIMDKLKARQARTLAEMQLAGLDVLLDESLPPRGEQLHVGREVWEQMQAVLPVVEEEIEDEKE